jgi:DNA-binding response OmpR family regulator
MSRGRLLLVEDDAALRAGVEGKLRLEGYEPVAAADGEEAKARILDGPFDLVVLDVMLPRLDGLSFLRWLRKKASSLPVLILSARGREAEKVEGLRAGADDYLAKPFGLEELVARVEALLRRTRTDAKGIVVGDLRIDLERRKAYLRRREIPLSRKEIEVLAYLARHRDRPVTRDEVLTAVWGHFASSAGRAVDFHILNLRRKLEDDPSAPRRILTRHGHGYQLSE